MKEGPKKILPTPRRVRVIHNHTVIVDTTKALHVWEHDYYPQLYFPFTELKNCTTKDKNGVMEGSKPSAAIVEITIPGGSGFDEVKTDRAVRFADDKSIGKLAGLLRLEFASFGTTDASSFQP